MNKSKSNRIQSSLTAPSLRFDGRIGRLAARQRPWPAGHAAARADQKADVIIRPADRLSLVKRVTLLSVLLPVMVITGMKPA